MKMKLKQLLKGIQSVEIKGSKEVEILHLCNNSKMVSPGSLFFAKKGLTQEGSAFLQEAKMAGASAVVLDLFDPFLQGLVQVITPDILGVEALVAQRFYGFPSRKLLCVGITGTSGKTTTSYLIKHLLDAKGCSAGLIGTIEWKIKDTVFPASFTTPDVLTNQKLLHEMALVGCKSVVMEVSSHALHQQRVEGIDYDIALFTNLSEEHLDYHANMEEYASVKAGLFASLGKKGDFGKPYPKMAILNQDNPWMSRMIRDLTTDYLTYGLFPGAELRAEEIKLSPEGNTCLISYHGKKVPFRSALIGRFNIYNCLAAIAFGLAMEWDLEEVLACLSSFSGVPGRLERVINEEGKKIFVDYAHKPDALKNVLETLREISKGRVLCLFGCGGNRDRLKRPKMGAIATELADAVFITSDNPRSEDPEIIIQEILAGVLRKEKVCVEVDRKKAIEKAIQAMEKDDVLLIAGKGHEPYQIFSHQTIHFDDRIIAKEYCR